MTNHQGAVTRRTFLRGSASAAALTALGMGSLAACGDDSDGAAGELIYAGFGGTYEESIMKAVFTPFAAANGVTVTPTADGSDVAKIKATVNSGSPQYDLVDAQGTTLSQFVADDLLQPLDETIVKSRDVVDAKLITEFSIPWYQFSYNMWWNTDAVDGTPESWADLWDVEKFPGKRSFGRLPWWTLEIALMADGVAADDLYPLDVDRAFASLDKIKPNAVFLDNPANAITSQEVVMGPWNLARIKSAVQSGTPLNYTWNQAIIEVQQLVVLKGSAQADLGMKAIEFAMQPQQQKAVLDALGYTPSVPSVIAEIDPEQAKDLPGTPATLPNSFYLDSGWWGENGPAVSKRWTDWLAS